MATQKPLVLNNGVISEMASSDAVTAATVLKQKVMNQSGSTMAIGSAVYVTSANGDNPVISLAQANAEATSSKTVGLLETDVLNGDIGNVIENGLIVGLDTSTATIGDPVWLSPTTAGGLLYGLANKPVAPYHMVFIGKVVRVHANQGSILISVQNGFELDELHDVSITSPANNQVIAYESATGLWKNTSTITGSTITATGSFSGALNGTVGATTPNTGAFTTLSASNNTVISVNSSSDALRITQAGVGNALVVEDSTNPDSNPFVIDQTGIVIVGNTTAFQQGTTKPYIQIQGTDNSSTGFGIARFSNDSARTRIILTKSRGGLGSQGIVQSGDTISDIQSFGSDGTNWIQATSISSEVDGTPGTNDMPGRLVFSTTASGSSSPTEALRIDNKQQIGVGGVTTTGVGFRLGKSLTNATNAYAMQVLGTIQSDVTGAGYGILSQLNTATASFSTQIRLFQASQGTIGAGSTVTNQTGFYADSALTSATNNYGFFGNIASGTGRYNLYMAGTANNYLAGSLGIGTTSLTGYNLRIGANLTGSVDSVSVMNTTTVQSGVTSSATIYQSQPSTAASAFTLGGLYHFLANQSTIGAGSTVTSQYGFVAESTLTGATNNYGFRGNIASGTGRYNLYMQGTADNYLAGSLGVGTTANASAIIDAQSTTKGVRFPNMTTAQKTAISSPATGLVVFDTTLAKLCVYTGAAWQTITSV